MKYLRACIDVFDLHRYAHSFMFKIAKHTLHIDCQFLT